MEISQFILGKSLAEGDGSLVAPGGDPLRWDHPHESQEDFRYGPPVFSSMRRKTGVAVIRVACPRDRTRKRRVLRIGIRTAKKTMNPPKM